MPPEPPGGTRPAGPVVLRIKLRYDDVEAMVSRFAPNVGKSGLFLPTKSLQPVGAEIKFELRLSTDAPVLLGLGRVKATKSPDPDNPKASFGMAIELMRVTRESRDLILRMLERRKQLGLPDVAIPLPSDIDAARRSDFVDTGIKDPASAAIPAPTAVAESAASEALLTAPRRASGPLAVAKSTEIEPLAPEPPRKKRPALAELIERASGPVAAIAIPGLDEDVDVGAALARARALAGGDLDGELEALRESAAAPIEISVEAASAELARQLGGVAVRRDARGQSAPTGWAPPPMVEIAAAVAVPAPAIAPEPPVEPPPVSEPEPEPSAELAAEPVADDIQAPEPADTVADPALEAPRPKLHEAVTMIAPVGPASLDAAPRVPAEVLEAPPEPAPEPEPELADAELAAAADERDGGEEHEVDPDQIDDEIHQLGEADFEEVEHTHIGNLQSTFEEHGLPTTPPPELEAQLDAQLAEAEQEIEHDDLGIGEASGHYLRSKIGLPPAEIYEGDDAPVPEPAGEVTPIPAEYQQDFIHQFDDAAAYDAAIDAFGHTVDANLHAQAAVDDAPYTAPLEPDEVQEVDDFEILAEADEADADLLVSSGEAEAPVEDLPPPPADLDGDVGPDGEFTLPPTDHAALGIPAARESDFAMRLDLGDDDEAVVTPPLDLAASAGNALAAFGDDEPSGFEYDEPAPEDDEPAPEDEFDERHARFAPAGFSAPDRFDQSDVIPLPASERRATQEPQILRGPPPNVNWDESSAADRWERAPVAPYPASEEIDLESALEALDVDLDELASGPPVPNAPTELARQASPQPRITVRPPTEAQLPDKRKSTRIPRGRAPRASTEDGVLIDFDDDD